ncbi:MAG: hypothetical protein AAGJ10_12010 [Bacteroidota bacterium]
MSPWYSGLRTITVNWFFEHVNPSATKRARAAFMLIVVSANISNARRTNGASRPGTIM